MNSPTNLEITRHEDERRVLIEWVKDFPMTSLKVVISKGVEIGKHYHNNKDEVFYLLKGNGHKTIDGQVTEFTEGSLVFIPRGITHAFTLDKGSILLGAANRPFDKDDEII